MSGGRSFIGAGESGADRSAIDAEVLVVSAEDRAEGLAERLASLCVAYLAALAASLSLIGGAWAMGLIAW